MIPKLYIIAGLAVSVVTVVGGVWFHGVSHGRDMERELQREANEKRLQQDKQEITKLRGLARERQRIMDTAVPDPVTDSLRETYRNTTRPEVNRTLSVCRLPASCDRAYTFNRVSAAVGIGG